MVAARFLEGANATTVKVAEDIAGRMHRSKDGTVAYCLDGMVKRLGLSRRCIAQHIAHLRTLGLLAWVEKGSAWRNALRARLGDRFGPGAGFKRSATIYAPVAPPVWDEAEGRVLDGRGYNARVTGVTPAGREFAIAAARHRQEQRASDQPAGPVENSAPCTPSVRVPKPRTPEVHVGGGSKDTPRKRAARPKTPPRRRAKGSTGWSPQQTAHAIADARFVQLHTWWTQGSCVRQLAYALRPLLAAGWSGQDCARELARWTVPARPRKVGAYVAAEIRRRANTGALFLPDGSVRPYRQVPEGSYDEWMQRRREQAERRWEETRELRAAARAALRSAVGRATGRSARSKGPRIPPGLQQARPDRVLTPSHELAALVERSPAFKTGEELWAEAEERAAIAIHLQQRGETWEYQAQQPAEPWQARA